MYIMLLAGLLPKMPFVFEKPNEWEPFFWVQFRVFSRNSNLSMQDMATHLLMSLKGQALSYLASPSDEIIDNVYLLINTLRKRYGQNTQAQTHRVSLANLRKDSQESNQYFASRVFVMLKAYPDINGIYTFDQLAIQQILNGINDQEFSLEVIKLSLTTLCRSCRPFNLA